MKKLAIFCFAFALTALTTAASADLLDEMDGMLSDMTNVTNPGAHMGARRGVISGGSIYSRAPISHENVANLQLPSISAGCSGIDAFGGSFSFISRDEFVQLLRNIAANAQGYAFQLALTSMCPTCASKIQELQSKVQELNNLAIDSCKSAQWAFDASGASKKIQDFSGQYLKPGVDAAAGYVDGALSYINPNLDGTLADRTEAARQQYEKAGVTGNPVHQIITKPDASGKTLLDWFSHGDIDLAMAMMSLVGGYVTVAPDNAGSSDAAESDLGFLTIPVTPVLNFEDILQGTRDPNDPSVESGRLLKVYDCLDYDEGSTNPSELCVPAVSGSEVASLPTKDITLKGMRSIVQEYLIGPDGQSGLVGKWALGTSDLTLPEKQFIEVMELGYAAQLQKISRKSKSAGIATAKILADYVAVDLTTNLVKELITVVRRGLSNSQSPSAGAILDALIVREAQMEASSERYTRQVMARNELTQFLNNIAALTVRPEYARMQPAPPAATN